MKVQSDKKPGKKQVHTLGLTLEEVAAGCAKRVTFARQRLAAIGGDVVEEEKELTVHVKPGQPDGTCFVFEGCAAAQLRHLVLRCSSRDAGRSSLCSAHTMG